MCVCAWFLLSSVLTGVHAPPQIGSLQGVQGVLTHHLLLIICHVPEDDDLYGRRVFLSEAF